MPECLFTFTVAGRAVSPLIHYLGFDSRKRLIQNLVVEQFAGTNAEVVDQWGNCPARDREGKEALWQLFKTSQKFRATLLGYIESGKLATEQLKRYDKESRLRGLLRRA